MKKRGKFLFRWIQRLSWWRGHQLTLKEVFTPGGPANRTYVPRPRPEGDLRAALLQAGTQVVVYGESGAGKSSLVFKVLHGMSRDFVTTRCTADMDYEAILTSGFFATQALARTGRKQSDEVELGLSGRVGDRRTAMTGAKAAWKVGTENTFSSVVSAPITAEHLASVLGRRSLTWVIDDFHKVSSDTKEALSHALKVFSDFSPSYPDTQIIVLGAAENAAEVWGSPANMKDRLVTIPLDPLPAEELGNILDTGAQLLNVDFSTVRPEILRNSVGIAGVTHALAHACCLAVNLEKRSRKTVPITAEALTAAREQYARTRNEQVKQDFSKALRRKATGKYNNCALILKALSSFDEAGATHAELLSRVRGLSDTKYPPGNLTTYLKQLQTEDRATVVRKTPDGYFRFATPLLHTYAQIVFKAGKTDHFWRLEATDEERAAATEAVSEETSSRAVEAGNEP